MVARVSIVAIEYRFSISASIITHNRDHRSNIIYFSQEDQKARSTFRCSSPTFITFVTVCEPFFLYNSKTTSKLINNHLIFSVRVVLFLLSQIVRFYSLSASRTHIPARENGGGLEDQAKGMILDKRIDHEVGEFAKFLSDYEPGSQVVVETVGNWYWIVDEIEAARMKPQLVQSLMSPAPGETGAVLPA